MAKLRYQTDITRANTIAQRLKYKLFPSYTSAVSLGDSLTMTQSLTEAEQSDHLKKESIHSSIRALTYILSEAARSAPEFNEPKSWLSNNYLAVEHHLGPQHDKLCHTLRRLAQLLPRDEHEIVAVGAEKVGTNKDNKKPIFRLYARNSAK